MPFDAMIAARPRTLRDALTNLGIEPISAEFLARHKRSQVLKHPPSLLYRYHEAVVVGMIGLFVLSIFATIAAIILLGLVGMLGVVAVLGSFIAGSILGEVKVRGEASWSEFVIKPHDLVDEGVPSAIIELAQQVSVAYPRARILIGKLVQSKEVIDPYLSVYTGMTGTEAHCLGIWENDEIIAIAQRH